MIAGKLGIGAGKIDIMQKQGSYLRRMNDCYEVAAKMYVKGIESFKKTRKKYKYPHIVVGSGHGGLRMSLQFVQQKQENFVCLDRLGKIGGTSWLRWANPQSRVQTELGTYQLAYSEFSVVP